jgi:hypothetical protein
MKSIDFDKGILIGKSGKEYLIQANVLSVARYEKYIHYIPQIAFGANFKDLFDSFKDIYEATTKGDDILNGLHVASNIAYNRMQDIYGFIEDSRRPPVIWFCMLFINYEDENLGEWDEAKMKKKIDDLDEYNVMDFFLLAKNCIAGLMDAYREIEEISKKAAKLKGIS